MSRLLSLFQAMNQHQAAEAQAYAAFRRAQERNALFARSSRRILGIPAVRA